MFTRVWKPRELQSFSLKDLGSLGEHKVQQANNAFERIFFH
jgi:hypothetical protein